MVCGQNLVCLANVFALAIAEGLSADELNITGALFTLIGDQLALYAACAVSGDNG
jgi:hypothetical protein